MLMTSGRPQNQTMSPLLMGQILLICVPTLPEGCGPLKVCKMTFLALSSTSDFVFSVCTQRCKFPSQRMLSTSKPFCSESGKCSARKSMSGASGELSNALTKKALGWSSGLAMVPKGLWRIMGQSPVSNRLCVRLSLLGSPILKSRVSNFPSDLTTTASRRRFGPRRTSLTVPLTGDTKRMRSSFLV